MDGKTLKKGKFSDKTGEYRKKYQQQAQKQSLTMKSWVMMRHQTDKEYEEYSTSEVRYVEKIRL